MSGRGRGRTAPANTSTGRAPPVSSFENLSIGSSAPSPAGPQAMQQQRPVQSPAPPLAVPSSSKKLATPARAGYGTIGRKCVIKANHFLVDLGQKDPCQYDVTFTSEGKPKEAIEVLDMVLRPTNISGFISDFVGEFLGRDISSKPFSEEEHLKVSRALRGVKVVVRRGERYARTFMVQGLTAQPLDQLTLNDDTTPVIQYLHDKYGKTCEFPHLPAIQAGTEAKRAYLPLEDCKFASGQKYPLMLNKKQVTNLLNATHQRPKDRRTMEDNKYNVADLVSKEFGMAFEEQLTSIDARVLPPPYLMYHDSSEVQPSFGWWSMRDRKMIDGGTVNYWAIANFSRKTEYAVQRFCCELVQMCMNKGMVFNPRPLIQVFSRPPHDIQKALVDILSQCNTELMRVAPGTQLQMLFVILPEAEEAYARIKQVCETELGIITQCCKPQHVMKLSRQYCENVALKINVKVGGRNTVLSAALKGMLPYVTDRPTIIFGADVTHPSPGEDLPSIAAVVVSMDWPQVTKYKALVSAQLKNKEIIQDLYTTSTDSKGDIIHGGLIRELLISFRNSTQQIPERIVYYRDGVSETQFDAVLMSEMEQIRKACSSIWKDYMPPVTFVVVQKRHHTRFFPSRHGDTDKSGNILPGTVVDTKICHPTEFDFYLCSHASNQGRSRPTHYHVLYDENKFTADGLQMLTNSLCYTYARCTRSVSIVPPAYYAHLAAFRARKYMEGGDLSDSDSRGARTTRDRAAAVKPLPVIHENVESVMFYC